MRKVSIIWKVTIWYTIFLCILAVMVVSVTYLVSERILNRMSKLYLVNAVENLAEEIEFDDGVLEADDEIDFLEYGVYLAVYDEDNNMLLGMVPKKYDVTKSYPTETIENISIAEEDWYIYEKSKTVEDYGEVIIRGTVLVATGTANHFVTTRVLLILSPIIILVATIGGYILTKQAFRPVNQMRRTVEQISSGKDLTRRVNLGEGEDELHKLGKTFDQMFERLEGAFEREKQFTSDVSHELRTPVSVILSQCEYAMMQMNGKETTEALGNIYDETIRMSKMISQLLLLSRGDQGGTKLCLEEVNLSELLEVIVDQARERAERRKITIHTEITENVVIQADETMLVRFFVNLLSNAICYGKDGGWIKVVLQRENEVVSGRIEDNGIGIAREEQDKIWKRFYQVDSSRTSKEDGNHGLGLAMVEWIAKAHGGEVWLQSELGVGSVFSFKFPIISL